jgi:hypothetical protein
MHAGISAITRTTAATAVVTIVIIIAIKRIPTSTAVVPYNQTNAP